MCAVRRRLILIWPGEMLPVKSHHVLASVQPTYLCTNKTKGLGREKKYLWV